MESERSTPAAGKNDWMGTPMPYANEEGDNDVSFWVPHFWKEALWEETAIFLKDSPEIFCKICVFLQAIARKRKKQKEETLTSYLNKYTSEDNASFEELTKVMREREDARRPWIYKAEEEHNKNLVSSGSRHEYSNPTS